MLKQIASAAAVALTLLGASATASHAGYWYWECDIYGWCYEIYVPTCGYDYYGWWVCG